jgi:hypothetical protein
MKLRTSRARSSQSTVVIRPSSEGRSRWRPRDPSERRCSVRNAMATTSADGSLAPTALTRRHSTRRSRSVNGRRAYQQRQIPRYSRYLAFSQERGMARQDFIDYHENLPVPLVSPAPMDCRRRYRAQGDRLTSRGNGVGFDVMTELACPIGTFSLRGVLNSLRPGAEDLVAADETNFLNGRILRPTSLRNRYGRAE